jgi:hypothetical protein
VDAPAPAEADVASLLEVDEVLSEVDTAALPEVDAPALPAEDYVTLSPVFPTATKPGYGPALGPAGAARVAGPVPWLALGGIDSPSRAAACAGAGAAGIAVLGAVMRASDPERVVRELATAFAAASHAGLHCGQAPRIDGSVVFTDPTQCRAGEAEAAAGGGVVVGGGGR